MPEPPPRHRALLVPIIMSVIGAWLFVPRDSGSPPTSDKKSDGEEEPEIDRDMWWSPLSPEELEANLLAECEEREAGYRKELEVAEDKNIWKVQAKLAMSLLETNASRIQPRQDRYLEGARLVEMASEVKPIDGPKPEWRTMLAKVALLLADFNDTKTEEASRLAEAAVNVRQNKFTNGAMGRAYLVDGCALACRARRYFHRMKLDPPGAVYAEGAEPKKNHDSYLGTAQKRLLEAGKRLHAAVDADLFEKDPTTYGPKAPKRVSNEKFIMAMGPYLKLLALDGYKGGISVQMMFELGGCDVFVGRRLDGKVCPPEEPPPPQPKQKKKKKSGTKKDEKGGMREIDLMI